MPGDELHLVVPAFAVRIRRETPVNEGGARFGSDDDIDVVELRWKRAPFVGHTRVIEDDVYKIIANMALFVWISHVVVWIRGHHGCNVEEWKM